MSGRNARNSDVSDDDMETDQAVEAGLDSDEEGGIRVDEDIYIPPPPTRVGLAANEPRLMIDKIVNENFKSYAISVDIGPFDECFSAIIGPNGSGKSNVIDSMLFVFGYRSSRIRTKKISELIHNSPEHPNVRSCKVSVHFRRIVNKLDERFETIPNSTIVISRTAFKDNSSFYELNNKKVQMKEINKLLKSEGIDLDHNRFLILQGEVEQIALMKPKGQNEHDTGMLEFLEDIIGTCRYKEPLEKLSEKVEVLTELRAEKLNRLRVVEKEKDELLEPMQDAVQYLQIENSITKYQHQLYHCKRSETKAEIVEKEAKKNELDTDLADLLSEMKKIHDEKDSKNKEFKEKCKCWDSLQKEKDTATATFDRIKKDDEGLHAELVEINKRRKASQASLKTETAKLAEFAKVPEKSAKSIEECEALVEKSKTSLKKEEATLEDIRKGLQQKTAPLLEQLKESERKLMPLNADVDVARGTFNSAQRDLNYCLSNEQTEKDKLEKLKEKLAETSESIKTHKEKMSSLNKKIPATEQSLAKAQKELETVIVQEKELTAKLKSKRCQYEEHKAAMNSTTSQNRVIESLMKEKISGRLPGIFGRLGDLGAIDAKYDIAISTACGALDNVVVDSADTGEGCINFLRQNDIGRMHFIALDKQSHLLAQCRQKIQTPENVPRLFDLIKVKDERVLPAFYFAIRDTLVANDLDQATRIAYGARRHRVVTLQGAVIEVAGTMSGGGRPLKGRMGQKVVQNDFSPADLEKLQKDRDALFEECNRLQLRQQPLEDQIRTLSTALHDMKIDRPKCDTELKALIAQEPSLREQVKVQTQKAAEAVSDPKKVKQFTKALEEAQKNLELVTERSKETKATVDRLKEEIKEIIDGSVKDPEKKIVALKNSITKAEFEINRLELAVKTAERDTKKAEKAIERLENDVKSCEQQIREKQNKKTEFENNAKLILEKLAELNEALEERDELAGNLKKELTTLETRESKMKALKIDLDQKISESDKALKELERMIPEYTRKIANLKFHEVPGEAAETLNDLTDEEVEALDIKKVAASLQRAKQRLPQEIPNMQIIKDYQIKEAAYLKRSADLEEITNARLKLREIYDTARRKRCDEFLSGFTVITEKLKEMYQMITMDGDAELELVDSMDPFSEGVVFSVRPPKKSWKNINNLSGGEKTLSSLALVFALHHYKPSPVYFMDEIDAALDFKNVSIIGNFIKERAKNSQFIVVSLRENMYELANILVGIYKTHNTTKVAVLNLVDFNKKYAKPKTVISLQTLKNRYASQVVRPTTQPQPRGVSNARASERNGAQMPATCPAAIEEPDALDTTGAADVSLGLGDTALPVTPVQTPRSRYSSSSDTVEGTPERQSLRKRRRL